MKKLFSVLMMIAMLASLPFASMAEEPEMDTLLKGIVTEIVDGGFVMEDAEIGEVMLNTSDATLFEGILADGELVIGQYVYVEYDGRTTFSLPPQAHADRIACHTLSGSVLEVLEDGSILMEDITFGDTIVHLPEGFGHVYAGMPITVYYDGAMTLSLPGQASASHIELPQLSGTVSSKTEEGFTLTDADGIEYEVKFDENTLISEETLPVEEEEIIAGNETEESNEEMTKETAGEISEEPAEEAMTAETETITSETEAPAKESDEADEEIILEDVILTEEDAIPSAELLSESAIEWVNGDTVTVYYNGMMTRSIPAQITAMEIAVIR